MPKILHESSGDVSSYGMEQGLSHGTGYINCYLACWKFTCQVHFDNTCTSSVSFQEVVNIYLENFEDKSLHEKFPDTEFFLVHIFPHSD